MKETESMAPGNAVVADLYKRYGFVIYRICRNILRSDDDARDALQIVFTRLIEHYPRIRDKERVIPWIFNTAKHHCYNVIRYSKKFVDEVDPDSMAGRSRIDEEIADRELLTLAFKCHKKVVCDAVYYTYVEGFDQEEIRKMTGQSPATIRRNLKKFKDSLPWLRKRLELQ